jgi:hypothetical protein
MTQSNDSDSISMRLSVKEIVKLYELVKLSELTENNSVKIEQRNGSGIGTSTVVHLTTLQAPSSVDITSYEQW